MKQSGHLNPSEETGTGCPVTSKYGRTSPNKHGGVGRQQHVYVCESYVVLDEPPALFVFPVCAYGGVVEYFWCLAFCVCFVSCIVMMSGCVLCARFLVPRFCF